MKYLLFLRVSVLLLLTQTAIWNCVESQAEKKITVEELHDAIKLKCPNQFNFTINDEDTLVLKYNDSSSGEYECEDGAGKTSKIYVKFRTCDNCIELDVASIAGMVIGDVVATCVVGVAVYLFASVIRSGPVTPVNKRSNRQLPSTGGGASNDPYQALRFNSPKDEYDKLGTKR